MKQGQRVQQIAGIGKKSQEWANRDRGVTKNSGEDTGSRFSSIGGSQKKMGELGGGKETMRSLGVHGRDESRKALTRAAQVPLERRM